MKIYGQPNCEKCREERAISRTSGMWLCGRCLEKYVKMMMLRNKDLFLTEEN